MFQQVRYVDDGQDRVFRTVDASRHQIPHIALSEDGDTLCVRGGPARSSHRVSSKQDHQVQAGPGQILLKKIIFVLNFYTVLEICFS